ncbi:MAG: gamma carbonic anhydrase family protein [Spirochaetes bacterium]|nr:gamma carbonic anhydrase family protein [Spirochaetota bacterium]
MIYRIGDRKPAFFGGGHYIAENATVIGSVELHDGASVWFNAVLRGDMGRIIIGRNSNVQDGCVLHTHGGIDLVIGQGVTVGHGAFLHGCEIGDETLVGIGAVVLNGARVGRGSLVAARALVVENALIPEGSLVIGAPGRVVGKVSDAQAAEIRHAWKHYLENSRNYLKNAAVVKA